MTTEKTARILALIAASQARIEGMKAENEQRLLLGESIAYGSDEFNAEASELKGLVEECVQNIDSYPVIKEMREALVYVLSHDYQVLSATSGDTAVKALDSAARLDQ
jgi:hypothetical protein